MTLASLAVSLLMVASAGGSGGGGAGVGIDTAATHARAKLISESAGLVPGATMTLGITFEIDPGWHLYWNGYNDAGLPPKAKWTVPAGYNVGEIQWPAPKREVSGGEILNHIYEKEVTLLVPITVPTGAELGEKVEIAADLKWLVCEEACIAEEGRVSITLGVTAHEVLNFVEPEPTKEIRLTRERLPSALPSDGSVKAVWREGVFAIEARGASAVAFFPATECAVLLDVISSTQAKGPALTLKPEEKDDSTRMVGIVEVTPTVGSEGKAREARHYWIDVKSDGAPGPTAKPIEWNAETRPAVPPTR